LIISKDASLWGKPKDGTYTGMFPYICSLFFFKKLLPYTVSIYQPVGYT
jgi:hypothetical protein